MINSAIEKIIVARNNVNLEMNEMMSVKKYLFGELLKSKTTDKKLVGDDINYVNELNTFDPNSVDKTKISSLGLELLYTIFGSYISIISSKKCEEVFDIDTVTFENEVDYKEYNVNVSKRMYLRFKAQTYNFTNDETIKMVRQQSTIMEHFGENFFVFKLNEHRAILLVNSFFRLYFDSFADKKVFNDLDITKFSSIPSFSALKPNEVVLTANRRYKYDIIELDLDSVDYLNSLCK